MRWERGANLAASRLSPCSTLMVRAAAQVTRRSGRPAIFGGERLYGHIVGHDEPKWGWRCAGDLNEVPLCGAASIYNNLRRLGGNKSLTAIYRESSGQSSSKRALCIDLFHGQRAVRDVANIVSLPPR